MQANIGYISGMLMFWAVCMFGAYLVYKILDTFGYFAVFKALFVLTVIGAIAALLFGM